MSDIYKQSHEHEEKYPCGLSKDANGSDSKKTMKPKRVVVWGTGYLGRYGLKAIIEHPDLELVGVHAWSPQKIGRDAGDLAGVGKTSVIATNETRTLIALDADCLAYFANGAMREAEITADVVAFLERGTNVVTISHFDLQYPKYGRPEYVEPVADACRRGGSSIFLTGEEPGFAFGQHLFFLLSVAGRIDSIYIADISNVQNYSAVDSLKVYGFNEDLDYKPPMFTGPVGQAWHVNTLRGIADYIGVKIDEFQQTWKTAAVDFDYETAAFGKAHAGKTAGTRWTVKAIVGDSPFIVYEKILRLHEEAGPDWPVTGLGKKGQGVTFKIRIVGNPNYEDEMHQPGGTALTPMAAVNAIPFVCDAAPGILCQQDISLYPPRNLGIKR